MRYLADAEALVEDEAFLEERVGQAPARLLDQLDVVQVAAPLKRNGHVRTRGCDSGR